MESVCCTCVPGLLPPLRFEPGSRFECRFTLLAFQKTYNTTWLIERHGYLTPEQFRYKQLQPVAAAA